MDLKIEVSEELRQAWPQFRGAAVFATVKNSPYSEELWKRIGEFTELYRQKYTIDSIKEMPAIQATRQAYKKCGKDPSRYRPSSEALCLASINSGHSIGGFDRDKIQGDKLVLGIGKAGEPYEGIGRGELNIEGMPVYRDAVGGVGTPTSDNERTKISSETTHLLAIMNAYSGSEGLEEDVHYMVNLLEEFADAQDVELLYFE